MSLKYVRHGCLGWVAVCGLWDGGSECRWKWRLKPEASLKHCLLLLLGHLLLTHTSGISLLDLKKSKTWITRSSRTKRTESTWSQSQALQFLLHGHYLLLLTPQTPRNPSWSRKRTTRTSRTSRTEITWSQSHALPPSWTPAASSHLEQFRDCGTSMTLRTPWVSSWEERVSSMCQQITSYFSKF